MKYVVITGSTRGLGLALAKEFLRQGCGVVISGRTSEGVTRAMEDCSLISKSVAGYVCDVRSPESLTELWRNASNRFGQIDIWINNAGINQPYGNILNVAEGAIEDVIRTNLLGTMHGSRIAVNGMLEQGRGQVFNMEGFGSNDMMRPGLNVYGTSKRAVTHFTKALAQELKTTSVLAGLLSPGMMVTDFVTQSESLASDGGKTRKIFNILGDRPETVAKFLVPKILNNRQNGAHFKWLTNKKAAYRFARAAFVKRDLFS